MKQLTTIEKLKESFPGITGVNIALLYGSFGRQDATPNSDIDIQLIVGNEFQEKVLINTMQDLFSSEIVCVNEVKMRGKVVVYFKSQPKVEFAICTEVTDINRNYLGSEITDFKNSILYERFPKLTNIGSYLAKLIQDNLETRSADKDKAQIASLIEKFIYEFENCSTMHRRSDAYQFYYFYNIAFHVATQLMHLSKGQLKYNFLPKYFVSNILTNEERESFYSLNGTLFLPEANKQKKILLEFFYGSVQSLVNENKLMDVKKLCEWIFDRDFFWNFRDISTHNPNIKSGLIYRTATMTVFQNEPKFFTLLHDRNIRTVIDLRAEREILENSYSNDTLSKITYIKTPFDPWNQPEWFVKDHHVGTNEEIAYRFFALGCNEQIKTAMEAIIQENEGSVAIHCFAGKDRTGIFISMLHLLAETPIETIYADYLASEVDVKLYRLNLVLDIIQEMGGIIAYLEKCGLTRDQIYKLKDKLIHGQ